MKEDDRKQNKNRDKDHLRLYLQLFRDRFSDKVGEQKHSRKKNSVGISCALLTKLKQAIANTADKGSLKV